MASILIGLKEKYIAHNLQTSIMLNKDNLITSWSLYTGKRGVCLGHARYLSPQSIDILPFNIAAPVAIMNIAKAHVPTVGSWYESVPDRFWQYSGAVIWLDAMDFTDEELTHIKGLTAWQPHPDLTKQNRCAMDQHPRYTKA